MNYQKIHDQIIERAKNRLLEEKTHKHHIIPKCLNGSNDKENIVKLTPREHFIVHLLLTKIYPNNYRILVASFMMSNNKKYNSKKYSWLYELYSKRAKGRKLTEETKQKMRLNRKGMKGLKHSEETKQKMILSHKGIKFDEDRKKTVCKIRTPESNLKRSLSLKGNKNSTGILGRKHSEETKKKISESNKIFWNNYWKNKKLGIDNIIT